MEERGMLDHTIVHGVFVGPARSGKNSLMERLLGRIPSSVSPSTGVAEKVVHVKVIQKSATIATNIEESVWSVMDYDDEVIKILLISNASGTEKDDSLLEKQDLEHTPGDSLEVQPVGEDDGHVESSETQNSLVVDTATEYHHSEADRIELSSTSPSFTWLSSHHSPFVPPLMILRNALKSKGLKEHFEKTWSLYLTNTGGQVEFQEVLPLLVSGPSLFFFTFRLDRALDECYTVEYELLDETKTELYTSTLTTAEGILQTLASISAMGTFVYKGLQKREVPLRPKVFFVGTHKDQLDNKTANDQIVMVDQQLQEIIRSTSHCKDLVEFASPSQLMFTVNNFSENDSDFKCIRSAVEQVVIRDGLQMTSPAHWLIYSLAIRNLKSPVISYDDCFKIAKQCEITNPEELNEALHFIHSKMGLIRYFPYKDVKDLVIIDPQFLFDKVTNLIVKTFTFDRVGQLPMEEFKQKGIFSVTEFERISANSESGMTSYQFGKLLESLRIAAPFEIDDEKKYFIPCVLAHTNKSENNQLVCSTQVPHLMVTFECGYCPKGLAGALIKYLMANEMESTFSWKLRHNKIFRNQVSFEVGPLDIVVLKISSTHLEIIFIPNDFPNRNVACSESEVCSNIRQAVEAGIRQVTSDINLVNAKYCLTFPCGCEDDHPGELRFVNDVPVCLSCNKTGGKYQLPTDHELWQICSKPEELGPLSQSQPGDATSTVTEGIILNAIDANQDSVKP